MSRVGAPLHRERRRDQRSDLFLETTIRGYRAAPLPATMLDLSASGAMLKFDTHDFLVGDEVIVVVRSLQLVATIAWLHESFVGAAFHRRIEPRELAWMKELGRPE